MLRDGLEIQEALSPPVVVNAGADSPGNGSKDGPDIIAISSESSLTTVHPDVFATDDAADASMMTYSPMSRSGSDAGSSTTSLGSRGPMIRRTGSQIANLRATFEQRDAKASAESPVKRFERFPVRSHSPRGPELDLETARLKESLKDVTARCGVLEEKARRMEEAASERQKYQDRCLKLEKELEDLRTQLRERGDEAQKVGGKVVQEKDGPGQPTNEEDAASVAMRQLQELKRSIATSARAGSQTTDSTLAQETQNLHHEVQNWVVNNFRRVKLTKPPQELCGRLESISEPKHMEYLRPVFQSYEPSLKLSAIQAVVVCYLVEIFQEPLLFGLPNQGDWRRYLRKATETLPSVLEPAIFNKWRSFTLDVIRKSGRVQESVESASRSMSEIICIVLSTLTGVEDFETQIPSLTTIVNRAVSLSHLYRVQRAEYDIILPSPGTRFSHENMEEFSLDGDSNAELKVKCATFPFVVKRGDENGENAQLTNIIVKAKVLCKS